MADRTDVDKLVPSAPKSGQQTKGSGRRPSTLPVDEPLEDSLATKRVALEEQAQKLADTLHYMGNGHSQRDRFQEQLNTIRAMLREIEQAIARSSGNR